MPSAHVVLWFLLIIDVIDSSDVLDSLASIDCSNSRCDSPSIRVIGDSAIGCSSQPDLIFIFRKSARMASIDFDNPDVYAIGSSDVYAIGCSDVMERRHFLGTPPCHR
jgi:hypothetical protein